MYHNPATFLLLLDYDGRTAGRPHSLKKLRKLVESQLSREHLIAQTPTCDIQSYGYASEDEFRIYEHTLGNLTLLSHSENSKFKNKPIHTKLTDPNLYASSIFSITRQLAHQYKDGSFKRGDISHRTEVLNKYIVRKYPLWAEC